MRAIAEAIGQQGIEAAWRGPEPVSGSQITEQYISELIEGLPRLQYPDEETKRLDLTRLASDFDRFKREYEAEARVAEINTEAHRRIVADFPDWKQRNALTRLMVLQQNGEANWTVEERKEVEAIRAQWDRVEAIRAAAKLAKATGAEPVWPRTA